MKDLRKEYALLTLEESEAGMDPFALFQSWFEDARTAEEDANAMSLATVDGRGQPDARIVLLKDVRPEGFVFFTNYESKKGMDLQANPRAGLCFFWRSRERQVRIQGITTRVSDEEAEEYFHSRPLESRYGALASRQSEPVDSRAILEQRMNEIKERYGEEPPRPPEWGGYILNPERIEFWQGRPGRLHDRLLYERAAEGWRRVRLCP
ncbi:MAG: pyridoxamine 5'-phosphate oxidase [Leptospiraceae bacterium]|nr:pyridoxamine 5'-phosphate oxidase [Leptospiraceae bacterium]MCB1168764.1 pyridoxamine 5'-phosphate oxidase [Leptospiraceae bacterium]